MDMTKKDITFIIPCHDIEDYICPLLDSLIFLDTTGLDVEYLFVLDNCSDNTQGKIEKKMVGQPYRIIHCDVRRCGLARNVGLDNSDSEFVWFVDGDDRIIQQDFLPEMIKYMREENAPMAKLLFDSNEKQIIPFPMMVWQYIYRRDFIGDLRFPSQQPGEDTRFMWNLFTKHNIDAIEIPFFNDRPYYYYLYNRIGSNMQKFAETLQLEE